MVDPGSADFVDLRIGLTTRSVREVRIVERYTTAKKRVVAGELVRRFAARSTVASARLERRNLPEGHVRSKKVEQYLAERRPQI
jgi:hypothetical protein